MSISNIKLPFLLDALRDNTSELLRQIDEDDALAKERIGDLIIANAGPGLIEPKSQHQLYAKGVVYTAEYQLISLPLIKFYNHREKRHNIDYTNELTSRDDITYVCTEKLDGSLIQAFAHDGEVHLTTRSRLTNPHRSDRLSFHDKARELLMTQAPQVLDANWLGDKTMVFELISPQNRQFTNYHGQSLMILTSVFESWRYWTAQEVVQAADKWGMTCAQILAQGSDLEQTLKQANSALENLPAASPEGYVLNFECDGEVLHRSKIKTPGYKALRRTVDDFTKRNFFKLLIYRSDLREWDALEAAMTLLYESRGRRGFDDDRRRGFERHFKDFAPWFEQVEQSYRDALEVVPKYYETHPREDSPEYNRAFALHHKDAYPKTFQFIIRLHRQGTLSWDDVIATFVKKLR